MCPLYTKKSVLQEKNGLLHGIKPLFFNNLGAHSVAVLKTLIFCVFSFIVSKLTRKKRNVKKKMAKKPFIFCDFVE